MAVETDNTTVFKDGGLRETSIEALAQLQTVVPDGIHTAGTASQISDGAAAVLLASERWVAEHGLQAKASVVDSMLIGVDPVMMLTGPHEVTPQLLRRNHLAMSDIDLVEINEAFASIVLSWADEVDADLSRVNPNGGAIALGHPLGATGDRRRPRDQSRPRAAANEGPLCARHHVLRRRAGNRNSAREGGLRR